MTNEEAKVFMLQFNTDKRLNPSEHEAVRVAIKALEQESCEDCISRKAVLGMQYRIDDSVTLSTRDVVNVNDIESLPSIQSKPKTDVLDKIRAELHATAEMHEDGDYYLRDEWIDEIFDEYKAEKE